MVFIKIKYGVSKSTLFLLKLKVWVGLIRVWKHLCFIPKSTFLWSKTIPCYSRCLLAPLMWKQRSAIIVFIRLKINILCFSPVINFCFSHSLFICLSFLKTLCLLEPKAIRSSLCPIFLITPHKNDENILWFKPGHSRYWATANTISYQLVFIWRIIYL